jgi:hypothetical protein
MLCAPPRRMYFGTASVPHASQGTAAGADELNVEQKKWSNQSARNFGGKEFLRFSCAFTTLLLIGMGFGLAFKNTGIIVLFLVLFWGILWLAPSWQPAYNIVHKIMGNASIPPALPQRQWKWWQYILIAFKVMILLVLLQLSFRLLFP